MSFGGIHPFLLKKAAAGGTFIHVWEEYGAEFLGTTVTGTDYKYHIFEFSINLTFEGNSRGDALTYCLIAGGGPGGDGYGHTGGGGAGGAIGADGASSFVPVESQTYIFDVGFGGAWPAANGDNTTMDTSTYVATGGGYGGPGGQSSNYGRAGGCGGGAGRWSSAATGGAGTQGGAGGSAGDSSTYSGAGGGGMGGDGTSDGTGAVASPDGRGGLSVAEQLTGTGIQICGGGGGSNVNTDGYRSLPGGGVTSPNYSGGKGGDYDGNVGEYGDIDGGYGGGGGGRAYFEGVAGDGGEGAFILRWRFQ